MAEGTIDRLEIEVAGTNNSASRSIGSLTKSLDRLNGALAAPTSRLSSFSAILGKLNQTINALNISKLNELASVKINASLSNNLSRIGDAVSKVGEGNITALANLGTALAGFSSFKLNAGSINQLQRLFAALKEWQGLDFGSFNAQLRELASNLSALSDSTKKFSEHYKELPDSMRGAARAARSVSSANKQLQKDTDKASSAMSKLQRVAAAVNFGYWARKIAEGITYTVKEVSNYIESMNLFAASMGKFADSADDFAKRIQDAMGIDAGEWSRFQGVLMSLGTGFGIAGDKAATMSQQMTQLGYDISSFYNLDIEEAMRKVQSGFAGELEPMRRIGYDLSVARMQIEATNLGIDKSVSSMTQAEKAALRYYLMMNQLPQVHGDMARTLNSPANQLRVLKAQFIQAARAIGNIFIPLLNMILPYAIAAAKAIRMLAQTIANFFGLDATFEVDYSSLENVSFGSGTDDLVDGFEDASDAVQDTQDRVDDLKRSVMGFDELNKLAAPTADTTAAGGAGGDTGGVGDLGSVLDQIPIDTYDFMKGLDDQITRLSDEIAEKLYHLLPIIAAIAAALVGLRIGSKLFDDINKIIGLAMILSGLVLTVWYTLDAWNNGLNWENLLGMLAGIGLTVGGLALMFGTTAAAVGLVVGGIVLMATGIHDLLENGPSLENMLATFAGMALVIGGLAMLFGPIGAAIGIVVTGIAAIVAGLYDMWQNGFSPESFALVEAGFMGIGGVIGFLIGGPLGALAGAILGALVGGIATAALDWEGFSAWLSDLWNAIVENTRFIWEPVATWINEHVVIPVTTFFSGLGEFFSTLWEGIVNGITEWWGGVVEWFDTHIITPLKKAWEPIAEWFSNLWTTISDNATTTWHNIGVFVTGIWTIIQLAWNAASAWFNVRVLTPVSNFFTEKWNAIKDTVSSVWESIRTTWETVSEWFGTNVLTPISTAFSDAFTAASTFASDAWNSICEIFGGLGDFFGGVMSDAWLQIKAAFEWGGMIFDGVVDAITNAFKWLMNILIDGLNWAIAQPFNGLNGILGAMRNWEIFGIYPFAGFWDVPVPQIPYLAAGGQIPTGQLFVARESGPELVGEMGGRSTVANNEQIIDGITRGVATAMLQVSAIQNTGYDDEQPAEIVLRVGEVELARAVFAGNRKLARTGELTFA